MLEPVKRKGRLNQDEAMQYALRSLGRHMQTRRELLNKLVRRSDPETAELVMSRLEEWGYIDDAAFAEAFVRSHRGRWGRLRIAAELRKRGVSEEIIKESLGVDDSGEAERALDLLERYRWRHRGEKTRMFRFLQGRGFDLGTALEAAENYLRLQEDEESG